MAKLTSTKKSRIPFKTKIWIQEQKFYFDNGFNYLQYFKYVIALGALYEINLFRSLKVTALAGIGYGIICYVFGWLICHSGFMHAANEVGNKYNPFVKEMRASINKSQGKI